MDNVGALLPTGITIGDLVAIFIALLALFAALFVILIAVKYSNAQQDLEKKISGLEVKLLTLEKNGKQITTEFDALILLMSLIQVQLESGYKDSLVHTRVLKIATKSFKDQNAATILLKLLHERENEFSLRSLSTLLYLSIGIDLSRDSDVTRVKMRLDTLLTEFCNEESIEFIESMASVANKKYLELLAETLGTMKKQSRVKRKQYWDK